MPHMFSNAEYADIHFIYGFCNGNARAAVREYQRRYPQRRVPDSSVFVETHRRLTESGIRGFQERVGRRINHGVLNNRRNDEILYLLHLNPTISTRLASRQLEIPHSTVWRAARASGFHPYHLQKVQALHPSDPERRLVFCRWYMQNYPQLYNKILWTDESTFTRRGITNLHNLHMWAERNPHAMRVSHHQQQFKVNVWLGMWDSHIIGPYFLPDRLNSAAFLNFLEEALPELLENVPLNLRYNSWIQLDGCPAHYGREVRGWLDTHYPGRWIGRGGSVQWPARSPDLTPLDFFAWGYLKDKVYHTIPSTKHELVRRIEAACEDLRMSGHQTQAIHSMQRRCQACIHRGGLQFESFL